MGLTARQVNELLRAGANRVRRLKRATYRHGHGGALRRSDGTARIPVSLRRVLARDLGMRTADQAFGNRVRGRQYRKIDLQQCVESVMLLAQLFFKQKTAYDMIVWLEFRRVLFRSRWS